MGGGGELTWLMTASVHMRASAWLMIASVHTRASAWLRIASVHTRAEGSWGNHHIHAPEDGIHFKDSVGFRPSDTAAASGVAENPPRNVPSFQLYL